MRHATREGMRLVGGDGGGTDRAAIRWAAVVQTRGRRRTILTRRGRGAGEAGRMCGSCADSS